MFGFNFTHEGLIMNNKLIKGAMLGAVAALTSMQSSALVIGHFDSSRELYGMDTGTYSN